MKIRSVSHVALLIAGASTAYADTFTLPSAIKAATVYRGSGVTITRSANIEIPQGTHALIIPNLPKTIKGSQIPPTFILPDGVTLLSSKLSNQRSVTLASPRQKEIEKNINDLEQVIAGLKSEIKVAEMQLSFLRSMCATHSDTPTNLSDISTSLDYLKRESSSILASIEKSRLSISLKQKEIASLKRELQHTGEKRQDYVTAHLQVQSQKNTKGLISIKYFMRDARWHSSVDAKLDTEKSSLTLSQYAEISQTTGESWKNIALSLAGNPPSSYLGGTHISSEFLSFWDKTMIRKMDTGVAMLSAPVADTVEEMAPPTRPRRQDTRYDHSYNLPGEYILSSDGSIEQSLLSENILPVKLVTRATPYQDTAAYVFADTTLTGFDSLQGLSVTAWRDDSFAGKGHWPNLTKDAKVQLPFGIDQKLQVTYKEQMTEDSKKGFINKNNSDEKRFLITIKNNNNYVSTVEIFDRYPVSTHEDIKVTPLKDATKPNRTDIDDKPGVISWQKELQSGEEWQIIHSYSIRYPTDKNIRSRNGH